MPHFTNVRGWMCAVLVFAVFVTLARAYPDPRDNYINDFAEVIKDENEGRLRDRLKELESKTGIEGTVVTVLSIQYYGVREPSIENFSQNLFNRWGVGNKEKNNGFMILVAVKDRACRIELGDGWGTGRVGQMQRIIDHDMIPFFKNGDYEGGIQSGTIATIEALSMDAPIISRTWFEAHKGAIFTIGFFGSIIGCIAIGINLIRHGKTGWGYLCLAFAGVVLIQFIIFVMRSTVKRGFGGGSTGGSGGASGRW